MSARLIVFAGPACSGKTELASRLAARLGAPHLQMDTTRMRILPDSPHTRADRRVAYRAMHFAAGLLLEAGRSVILDAPYGHLEDRQDLAGSSRAPLYLVECRVSPATAARRFLGRFPDPLRLDLSEERVRELVQSYPYWGQGLSIDTEEREECLAAIEAYLASGRPATVADWAGEPV